MYAEKYFGLPNCNDRDNTINFFAVCKVPLFFLVCFGRNQTVIYILVKIAVLIILPMDKNVNEVKTDFLVNSG